MFKVSKIALVDLNDTEIKLKPDQTKNVLFILAGIEGNCNVFQELVNYLNKSNVLVFGLEYTLEVPFTSINESAKFYMNLIEKKLKEINQSSFHISGYSYGRL